MRKAKWIYTLIALIASVLTMVVCMSVKTGHVGDELQQDNGYTIDALNVDIRVNKDGVCHVVENITVTFKPEETAGPSHGIYRYIPYEVTAVRDVDGKVATNNYKVKIYNAKGMKGQHLTFLGEESGFAVYRFGSEDSLVNGETISYFLSYDYALPDDRYKEFDDFYFNIVGNGWTTTVNNVSFKITFPEDVAESGLNPHFYAGETGSSNKADVTTSVNGNVIQGVLNTPVKPGEAFTIKTDFPNGYFNYTFGTVGAAKIIAIVAVCVVLLMLVLLLFMGRNQLPVVPVVNFEPPKGMNPLEMKVRISSTGITSKDVSAMIIYWANLGYIKIIKENDKKPIIQKVKDLDKMACSREKEIFDILVSMYAQNEDSSKSAANKLDSKFDLASRITAENVALKSHVGNRYTKKSVVFAVIAMIVTFAVLLIPIVVRVIACANIITLILSVVSTAGGLALLSFLSFKYVKDELWGPSVGKKVLYGFGIFVATCLATAASFLAMKDSTIMYSATKYLLLPLAPLICLAVGSITDYEQPLKGELGEIYGYANNLLLVDNERMKVLLKDNPTLFYDVLPYTYVLGINKKFTKKFESLTMTPPVWLVSTDPFSLYLLASIHTNITSDLIKSVVISSGAKGFSSGGGFGGGGFSGGGFGGGGGGRW